MSNYYCNTPHRQPDGMCYITQPCYEQDNNVWAQCEYCGVCYNVFLTPRDSYGGGVDLNQCKKEITRHGKYSDFLRVFDWALQHADAPAAYCINGEGVSWLGNACCSYTTCADVADAYNYAESPIADYCHACDSEYYYDWYAYRCDHDFAMAINPFWRERMRDQMDYLSVYGNWKDACNSGSTYFSLCDCRGGSYTYCACNGGAWLCAGAVKSLTECGATEQGWVIPYMRPYACAYLCMSCRGDDQKVYDWGGEPYDGGGYTCVCCGSVTCPYDEYTCICSTYNYYCALQQDGTPLASPCATLWSLAVNASISYYPHDSCGVAIDADACGCPIGVMVWSCYRGADDATHICGHAQFPTGVCGELIDCVCNVVNHLTVICGASVVNVCVNCGTAIDGSVTIAETWSTHQCDYPKISTCVLYSDANDSSCWLAANTYVYALMYGCIAVGCEPNLFPDAYNCYCSEDYCTCVTCYCQCDVCECVPLGSSQYLLREPCETDGVLYFGLPNYAIGSIPIKRIKCTIDNTPSVSYMRNESSRAECWSARDMAFAENSNKYKFCFITFPNSDESLIDNVPKMMSCAIWYYLCSYKCEAGQYVAMCKSSVNVLNRDMCGAKMTYYSFQGYSIGGAYL